MKNPELSAAMGRIKQHANRGGESAEQLEKDWGLVRAIWPKAVLIKEHGYSGWSGGDVIIATDPRQGQTPLPDSYIDRDQP
jgi:hypothetical protein